MTKQFEFLSGIAWVFTLTSATAQVPVTATPTTIEGTPYLDETFIAGEINYEKAKHKVPVRYNIFQDVMEYKQSGRSLVLDPGPAVTNVYIGTTRFAALRYESKGKLKYGFFVLLDSGKVMLFSKKVVTLLEAKKGGALDGSDQPQRYNRSADIYYYKIGGGELQKIDNIKSMIASFPDKQEDLALYVKKEKVSPRKEKTLIQLIQYYNSM